MNQYHVRYRSGGHAGVITVTARSPKDALKIARREILNQMLVAPDVVHYEVTS